jgi:DNA-binding response OmpR family regulator
MSGEASSVVMLLEPDVLVRMSVAEFLRECGYRVIEAHSPAEVFTVLQSGLRVDILFSEVRLQGDVDGFTLARTVRQTYPQVDVILTAGVDSVAEKSKDLCEEGPIGKPYHPQDVADRIKVLLERRRATGKRI